MSGSSAQLELSKASQALNDTSLNSNDQAVNGGANAAQDQKVQATAATVDIPAAITKNKALGYSKSQWKIIQKALGFTGKDVDGYVGKNTTGRIAQFQESNNIAVTGVCDADTYKLLVPEGSTENDNTDSAALSDKQIAKAQTWYSNKDYTEDCIKAIQSKVGVEPTGTVDVEMIKAVAQWQANCNCKPIDGEFGTTSAGVAGITLASNKKASSAGAGATYGGEVDNSEIPAQSTVRANKSIYGDINSVGGQLVAVNTPYQMYYDGKATTIRCHKKCADRVANIFNQTRAAYTDDEIKELGLNNYSGCYNKRKTSGGSSWSIHSWAMAIDLDAGRNPLKSTGREPLASEKAKKFWEIVESNGGHSLGREKGYDWMHFQFATFK